jgi:Sec-independent protein translocase protein TatA
MSLGELLVIGVICILVIKPEDLPVIFKKIARIRRSFKDAMSNFTTDIMDRNLIDSNISLPDDIERINFYLQKITDLGGNYDGEYSLEQIKAKYHALIQEQIPLAKESEAQQRPS